MVWGAPAALGAYLLAMILMVRSGRRGYFSASDIGYHITLILSGGWLCAFVIFFGIHPDVGWGAWRWVATALNLEFFFY